MHGHVFTKGRQQIQTLRAILRVVVYFDDCWWEDTGEEYARKETRRDEQRQEETRRDQRRHDEIRDKEASRRKRDTKLAQLCRVKRLW